MHGTCQTGTSVEMGGRSGVSEYVDAGTRRCGEECAEQDACDRNASPLVGTSRADEDAAGVDLINEIGDGPKMWTGCIS